MVAHPPGADRSSARLDRRGPTSGARRHAQRQPTVGGMPGASTDHPPIERPLGPVTTERLDLQRFTAEDLDELATVFARPEVWRFPYGRGFTYAETASFLERQIQGWAETGFGCWLARERRSGRVIGYVGLSVPTFFPEILPAVEVGWRLDPDVWGRGYATEGATAALDEAFATLGLGEVCSLPQADNQASVRVARRLGLRCDRQVDLPATDRRGSVIASVFTITAAQWRARVDSPPR